MIPYYTKQINIITTSKTATTQNNLHGLWPANKVLMTGVHESQLCVNVCGQLRLLEFIYAHIALSN